MSRDYDKNIILVYIVYLRHSSLDLCMFGNSVSGGCVCVSIILSHVRQNGFRYNIQSIFKENQTG